MEMIFGKQITGSDIRKEMKDFDSRANSRWLLNSMKKIKTNPLKKRSSEGLLIMLSSVSCFDGVNFSNTPVLLFKLVFALPIGTEYLSRPMENGKVDAWDGSLKGVFERSDRSPGPTKYKWFWLHCYWRLIVAIITDHSRICLFITHRKPLARRTPNPPVRVQILLPLLSKKASGIIGFQWFQGPYILNWHRHCRQWLRIAPGACIGTGSFLMKWILQERNTNHLARS